MQKITDEQFLEYRNQGMTLAQIATVHGMSKRAVEYRSARLAKAGFGHGHSDVAVNSTPTGYAIKGTSTMYGKDGDVKLQWVKTNVDQEKMAKAMEAALEAFKAEIPAREPQAAPSHKTKSNLANLYTISDYHLGMLAWEEETGDDWDMKIAKDLFYRWFGEAFRSAPDASVGIINLQGDFAHFDSLDAVTPASGHVLDADTRYQKLVRYMLEMVEWAIDEALKKHDKVELIIVQGNHDESGMIWLAESFNMLYRKEPRVNVDTSPDVYKAYQHGKTSLFFHHGHKAKMGVIAEVMISKFRKMFGETDYSYVHVGHLHHQKIEETRNMIVEQHRTLAAKDAYASRGGWMSGRGANVITYSKEYGEVSRININPEMLK